MLGKLKVCLVILLAFAVMVQYSFTPQILTAYGEEGEQTQATQEVDQPKDSAPAPKERATEPVTKAAEPVTEAPQPVATEESADDADSDVQADAGKDEKASSGEAKSDNASEETDEGKYPAQTFSGSAGSVKVNIDAPKGALPKGTELKLAAVSKGKILDAVNSAVDGEVDSLKAVDISFVNKDGKTIEPKKSVSVKLNASGLDASEQKKVVHITDGGSASVVASASKNGVATFKAKDFSPYAIVALESSWTVAFMENASDEEPFEEKFFDKDVEGQTLGTLPEGPTHADATFIGWYTSEGTQVTEDTVVNSDMMLYARYDDMVQVKFIIHGDEDETVLVEEFDRNSGETIGILPQAPFKDGSEFVKWVLLDDPDTEVTADTIVPENGLTAVAVFKDLVTYDVVVTYFYTIDGQRVEFLDEDYQIGEEDFPYTINPPKSTRVDEEYDASRPTYYPSEPTITITEDDIPSSGNTITKEVEYVEYTATYDFVYLLKTGDGYENCTEIGREHVNGVLGSTVTPTIKDFPYAEYDRTESYEITQAEGQELPVYYDPIELTLTYDTNGGDYLDPYVGMYQDSVELETPTRTGYNFVGWYTDADLTQEAANSFTLEADTTLYAKWTGAQKGYTIVYMKEKYNPDGENTWVYENSRQATGTVGETVVATSAPSITMNGYEPDADRNQASSVVVKADGSSVLTVYYSLIRYDLTFVHRTGNNYNNASVVVNGRTYTNTRYTIEDVVLGQDISSLWPTTVNSGRNNYVFTGWSYTNSTGGTTIRITKVTELTYELVATANNNHDMTYNANYNNNVTERAVEYWLQQADGTYVKDEVLSQTYNYSQDVGAKDVAGYSQHSGTPEGYEGNGDVITSVTQNNRGNYVQDDNRSGGNSYTYYEYNGHLYRLRDTSWRDNIDTGKTRYNVTFRHVNRFYYDRSKYTIEYEYNGTTIRTTDPIFFEADISEYNYTPDPPEGMEDYEWGGWYADSALQSPYTFGTMPGNNLIVFAKWIAPQFTVSFDVNGGQGSYDSQTVDKNTTVDSPGTPTKTNYIFDGWWTEAEGGTRYDWNKPVTEDFTLYAHWKQETLSYTVHYYEEGTENSILPDRTVSNPAFVVGQTITEDASGIAGYRPDQNSKSIDLAFGINEITFYYSKIEGKISYTVKYVLDSDDTIAVHEPKTVEVDANHVTAREYAAAVDMEYLATQTDDEEILSQTYYPLENAKSQNLTSGENIIEFRYANYQTTKVTVNYRDMDGNLIQSSDPEYLKRGATYSIVTHAPNANYIYHHHDVNGETTDEKHYRITGDETELVVDIYYQVKLTIEAKNKTKPYDGEALVSSGVGDLEPVSGLVSGHRLTGISFTGSQTNAGSHATTPKDAVIEGAAENYYHILYMPGTLTVTQADVTVIIEPDRWTGNTYTGSPYATGFTNPGKTKSDYVMINNAGYNSAYLDTIYNKLTAGGTALITETDADTYTLPATSIFRQADLPVDNNYNVTLIVRDCVLEIKPAPITVSTGSDEKEYDGTPLTKDQAEITGLVNGETAGITATGSQTEVGSSDNSYTITWAAEGNDYTAKQSNYTITEEDLGTLEVTENDVEITVTADSDSKMYDGEALTAGATVTGVPDGFTYAVQTEGSVTNVSEGTVANNIKSFAIFNGDGEDVTANFTNITKTAGELSITPRTVTLTSETASKEYDGSALTRPDVTVGGDGFVEGEVSNITATGTITKVGSVPNTITFTEGEKYDQANYSIQKTEGTLTITKKGNEITITAPNDEKTYDGVALENDDYTFDGLPEGYTIEVTVEGSALNVSDTAEGNNKVTGYIIKRNGEDVTDQFDADKITVVDGTLTINVRNVTLTSETADKDYDGTPLTKPVVNVGGDGFVEGEVSDIKATGTITDVGIVDNTITYTEEEDFVAGNYNITKEEGKLTINPKAVTVKSDNDSKTYGEEDPELTATVTGLVGEDTVEYSISREAGEDVGTYTITPAGEATQGNYKVTYETGTFTINPKAVTVTADDASKVYDNDSSNPAEYTATVDGLVGDDTINYTVSRVAGEDVGTYTITPAGAQTQGNYTVSYETGTFTITPAKATVQIIGHYSPEGENPNYYTGNPYSVEGYEIVIPDGAYLTNNDIVHEGTASIEETDAGEYQMGLKAEDFSNTNANYEVEFEVTDGYLVITPTVVTVTITGHEETFTYDGDSHTASGYDAVSSIPSLYDPEDDSNVSFTGTAAITKTDKGEYPMGLASDQFTNNNPNFNVEFVVEKDGKLTINPKAVTVTADNANKIYDNDPSNPAEYTATVEGLIGDDTIEYSVGRAAGEDVGTYTITPTGDKEQGNYTITYKTGMFTINPKAVTVTADDAEKVYDNNPSNPAEYTATVEGLVGNDTIEYSVARETGENVGEYTITPTGEATQGNYTVTYEEGTFTITPASATITVPDASKIYGDPDPDFGYATVTGLVDGDAIAEENLKICRLTSEPVYEDAGTYEDELIPSLSPYADIWHDEYPNYTFTLDLGNLTINARQITVTADDASKTYDNDSSNPAKYTAKVTGLPEGVDESVIKYTVSREAGEDVGEYTITPDGNKQQGEGNYEVTYETGTFTITPKAVTVTADNNGKTYGEDDPELTATAVGLVGDDTIDYSVSREAGEDVGEYEITATGEEAQGNYTITYKPGTFVITKAGTMAVTATDYDGDYDGNTHKGGATVTGAEGTTTIKYSTDGGETWTDTPPSIKDVGEVSYIVKVTNPNYDDAEDTGTLKVSAKAVTVTADNAEKVYDKNPSNPAEYTATVEGLVGNDTIEYSVARETGENVGEYTITPTGEATQGNYTVTYEEGTFTITPASATITVPDASKIYGNPDPDFGYATVTGLVDGDAIPQSELKVRRLTSPAYEDAGTYEDELIPSLSPYADIWHDEYPNYTFTLDLGNLTINARQITVTADDASKTYDNDSSNPAKYTATVTGLPDGVDESVIKYTVSREAGEDVGEYTITPDGNKQQGEGNYEVTYETGTFTITPKAVTVTADDANKIYGEQDPEFTATVTGLAEGDDESLISYTTARDAGEDVGEYEITATGEEAQGNYTVTYETGTFTIKPKAVTVTPVDSSKVYGEDDPEFEATVEGLVGDDDESLISYTISREEGEDVGEYVLTAEGEKVQGNYKVTYEEGTFTITPASATITVPNAEKVYGDPDPDFGYATVTGLVSGDSLEESDLAVKRMTNPAYEDAGTYVKELRPTLASIPEMWNEKYPNYTFTVVLGDLTIKPRQITVTADDASKVYDKDSSNPAEYTAKVTGLPDGVDESIIQYTVSRETGEDVGEYTITPNGNKQQGGVNYEVTYVTGTFTITPATVTVKADNKTKAYRANDPELTATITGLIGDDDESLISYTISRDKGESAGTYAIRVTGEEAQGNYTVVFEDGVLTINRPAPTPTPTPGGGDRTPVTPATVNPVPAPAEIADTPAPTAISDEPAPLADNPVWALINLLCMLATALLSLIMLARYFGKRQEEDEETGETIEYNRKGAARLASLVPAIGAIIAFILTENMGGDMVMVDKWTILMVVILAIQGGVGLVARVTKSNQDYDEA